MKKTCMLLDCNKNHKRIPQNTWGNWGGWILVSIHEPRYLHCMLRAASLTREYPEVLLVAMHEKVPESSSRVTRRIWRWLPSWKRRLVGTIGLLLWAQLNTMCWRLDTSQRSRTSEPSITSMSSGLELK